jgi:hypothetical protein
MAKTITTTTQASATQERFFAQVDKLHGCLENEAHRKLLNRLVDTSVELWAEKREAGRQDVLTMPSLGSDSADDLLRMLTRLDAMRGDLDAMRSAVLDRLPDLLDADPCFADRMGDAIKTELQRY